MDYKLYLFCTLAFFAGWFLRNFKVYIGTDEKKYEAATFAILLRK
jgi:hypothetical protein